ncbi:hypothetical protein ACOCEA_10075 [Maribacter sp. CXY002]|uniref:hypothetical protein n=1 Tax=Maribacter luteocoastalis TaxID=3407671 RepID=UPI003B679FF5
MIKIKSRRGTLTKSQLQLIKKCSPAIHTIIMRGTVEDVLVFPYLNNGDNPTIGDYATINGKLIDAERIMPDGSKYVFRNGRLMEIIPESWIAPMCETKEERINAIAKELTTDFKKEISQVRRILGQ